MCVHAATNYTDTMLEYGGVHGQDVGLLVDYRTQIGVLVDYTDTMLEYWWATLTQCWSIGGLCGQDVGVLVD